MNPSTVVIFGMARQSWLWRLRPTGAGLALILLLLIIPPVNAASEARRTVLPASAAGPGQFFTLTVSSAFARIEPDARSKAVFSAFRGQTLLVLGVDESGTWLRLSGDQGLEGWLPAAYGFTGDDPAPAPDIFDQSDPSNVVSLPDGVIGPVGNRVHEIYSLGLRLGNNPRAFAKVGDCNSENGRFLVFFEHSGQYQLGRQFGYLQSTIDQFAGSFARTSLAARSGFSPSSVLDPTWSDPAACPPGEGPLQCEYRLVRPAIAFIALGTHHGRGMRQYEADMRLVMGETLIRGIVPILVTKADDVEGDGRVNAAIRRLAAEYDVPLWDFWLAAQRLPLDGLSSDGIHLTYSRPIFDDPWVMQHGWPWRNLTALLALDAVQSAVEKSVTEFPPRFGIIGAQ